jgi:D-galactose 1-dehydrogenase
MRPLRVAIIGFGKIARDQHVPAIAATPRFELAATVSRQGAGPQEVSCFANVAELLRTMPDLEAVSICTPPTARYDIARECIEAGLHIMLEKPPSVTLAEIEDLACLAEGKAVTLFTTWHAQHNPAVEAAAEALAGQRIAEMQIVWREDVRKWHPGQQWIWEPGGFGVFDPGINAFSIATRIMPDALFVRAANLLFPRNKQAPIAATLSLASPSAAREIQVELDWRHSGVEAWNITVRTETGMLIELSEGGSRLSIDGTPQELDGPGEYPSLYRRFLDLIDSRSSQVDVRPLRMVADAYLIGSRTIGDPFED